MSALGNIRGPLFCPKCGEADVSVQAIATMDFIAGGSWRLGAFSEADGDATEVTCWACEHTGPITEFIVKREED